MRLGGRRTDEPGFGPVSRQADDLRWTSDGAQRALHGGHRRHAAQPGTTGLLRTPGWSRQAQESGHRGVHAQVADHHERDGERQVALDGYRKEFNQSNRWQRSRQCLRAGVERIGAANLWSSVASFGEPLGLTFKTVADAFAPGGAELAMLLFQADKLSITSSERAVTLKMTGGRINICRIGMTPIPKPGNSGILAA